MNIRRTCETISLLSALAFLALVLASCGGAGGDAQPIQTEPVGLLRKVRDASELETALKGAIRAAPAADALTLASATTGRGFSGTYTQEANVDEFDAVKYDGSLLFVAPQRALNCCFVAGDRVASGTVAPPVERAIRILRTDPGSASARPVGRIALDQNVAVQGLYVAGARLVALTSETYWGSYGAFWTALPFWAPSRFGLRIYDIADPAAPRLTFAATLDGSFVDSRRVGNNVYFISRYAPRVLLETASRANIDGLALSSLLPQIVVDGNARPLIDPARCYVTSDDTDNSSAVLTSLTVVPIDNPTAFATTCYNEDAYGVYMSEQSLYLTQYRSIAATATTAASLRSRIHKFDLSGSAISYRGSAEIDGAVWTGGQADFRLSEYAGLLRVVTTEFVNDPNDSVEHRLYLLRQNATRPQLDLVGQLPNSRRPDEIGKANESLYGVRFVGNRAYASTFRRIDPLISFDLSDATDPRIAGTLELPGFSDFLHAVTDNLLLGIGEAENGGVRVALFDVSRLDQPREIGGYSYGARGTYSEARYDRHAFAYLADAGGIDRFALPINLYSTDGQFRFVDSSLRLFEIRDKALPNLATLAQSGRVLARINNAQNTVIPVYRHRAFLHPSALFYVADDDVLGAQWNQPDRVNGPY